MWDGKAAERIVGTAPDFGKQVPIVESSPARNLLITLPELGEGIHEATVLRWFVEPGGSQPQVSRNGVGIAPAPIGAAKDASRWKV